ncbi:MAG: response regulator [Ignavibacteriae bacterium]|nr:response regulator [Ignavibacteriota bacterium]
MDDDILSCAALARLLTAYCSDVRYVASFTDASRAVDFAASGEADVFFVSLELPDNGALYLAESLRESTMTMVFISTSGGMSPTLQHMGRTLHLSKPVDIEQLRSAIVDVVKLLRNHAEGNTHSEAP